MFCSRISSKLKRKKKNRTLVDCKYYRKLCLLKYNRLSERKHNIMSQSDLNTDFYISAYVRRDLYFNQIALYPLLSRYYFGFYFSQTTSHLQTVRFYKICASKVFARHCEYACTGAQMTLIYTHRTRRYLLRHHHTTLHRCVNVQSKTI